MAIDFSKLMKKKGAAPPVAGPPPPDMSGMMAAPQGAPPDMGALMGQPSAPPVRGVPPRRKAKTAKRGKRY